MPSPSIRRPLSVLVAMASAATLAAAAAPAVSSAATTTLKAGVSDLRGATESRTGYERDKFKLWVDADGDGCDTRREVLIDEARTRPTVGSGCSLTGGRWTSPYDGASWTDIADLDIDHVVPLAEAWDSGASAWSASKRQSYANDLSDPRTLIAVTDNVNQAKGDQDPSTWEPSQSSYRCTYAADWVSIKLRWNLAVDSAERSALQARANACPSTSITYSPVG